MKSISTFPRGGVHPHDHKELSNTAAIRNAPIPAESILPMHQHMGSPAECLVAPGDEVREGMLLGKSTGMFSANVHCPVPGSVTEIRDVYLPTGIKSKAVVIAFAGEFDQLGKTGTTVDWQNQDSAVLLEKIRDQGIVGLGGATFPTPIKFTVREGSSVEYLVVNGVECEPFLTADHRLMVEKSREIITGLQVVGKILSPEKVCIGIEMNKPDAVEAMRRAAADADFACQVVPLKMKYPQGDEKQLLKAVTGREVPSGALPLDIGAVVSNVGTVYAIYQAVVLDKPLIERVVTVSGSAIKNPGNLKVRLGTKIGELFEDCGGFVTPPAKIISGGPMMGFAVTDLDMPVSKGTSGILALSKKDVSSAEETNCLACGRCIVACPLGLSPTTLVKWIDHQEYQEALKEGLMDCKECGCCSYTCPAHIPLVQYMKLGKIMTRRKKA